MPESNTTVQETEAQESPELVKRLEELKAKNEQLSASVSKLTGKNEELIGENRRWARIDRMLKAIDIDPSAENADELLLEKLSEGIEQKLESAKAASQAVSNSQAPTPTPTAADLELKGQLKALQKKLAEMERKAQEAEERERQAVEKRKRDYVELKVKEALQTAGCIQPNHFYKLRSDFFRLSDDGETVIGGPESDPRSLEDAIESFKDDQEFSMYFRGSGATGSGLAKGQGGFGGQSLKNPFRTDQLNVTEAASIFSKDPEKAKRLILEARSAGKLDPKLGQLAGI